jgi:hypothetical protein
LSWSDQLSLVLPLSKNKLGERAGSRRRNFCWGDVEPFQVDRGLAHAQQPRDQATPLPGAAAQVAGMITANRAGNPHWR